MYFGWLLGCSKVPWVVARVFWVIAMVFLGYFKVFWLGCYGVARVF